MSLPTPPRAFQIIAYFPEWEYRRPYLVKDIEASGSAAKLTLINYAFGFPAPDSVTGRITCQMRDAAAAYQQAYSAAMSIDGQPDRPDQPLRGHFNQLKKLKARHPGLKVVISLGGWTESTWFSDAAASPQARQAFVASCIDMYVLGNLPEVNGSGGPGAGAGVFDGIDIDWEYPVAGGNTGIHNRPEDAENFVLLLEEFRRQYQSTGRPDLLLTMAAPGPAQARQFNMPQAQTHLDLINLMTYDFPDARRPQARHHTNLCNSSADTTPPAQRVSADATVRIYRDVFGIPAEKLVLGAAFYGRSWKNVPDQDHGLFQPGEEAGGRNYNRLVEFLDKGYTRHWDDSAKAPWLYSRAEQIFWSYDDAQSLALKAQYIKHHRLGGVMFWEITGDDAAGTLVDTLYQGLQPGAAAGDPCNNGDS